jgi:hypothetical protein
MLNKTGFSLIAASLLLAGCGGGGGGGGGSTATASSVGYDGPTAGVAMTDQASADEVASNTMAAAVDMDLADFTSGLMKSGTSSTASAGIASYTKEMVDRGLALAAKTDLSTMAAGVTDTQVLDCAVSGTVTMSATAADEYNYPSAGDSFSMTANNCDDGYGEAMNGGFSVVFSSYTETAEAVSMTIKASYSNLTISSTSTSDYFLLNGGFTMSMNMNYSTYASSFSLSGDAILVKESYGGVVEQMAMTNFSFVDTFDESGNLTVDHDYTFYSTDIGGYVTVATTTPIYFYAYDYYPSSGVVVITGDGGAKVRVTALDNTTVQFDYDLDADGEYGLTDADDPASQTKAWTAL